MFCRSSLTSQALLSLLICLLALRGSLQQAHASTMLGAAVRTAVRCAVSRAATPSLRSSAATKWGTIAPTAGAALAGVTGTNASGCAMPQTRGFAAYKAPKKLESPRREEALAGIPEWSMVRGRGDAPLWHRW